jgi:putative N6-adenine-specific DNA methylase
MQENLEKRLKRQIHGKPHRFTAIAPLGFEETLVKELRQIGVAAENGTFETVDGKVIFTAKITEAWKAVARSRIANRVLMDIASFKAENFRVLEKKAAEIPWELFLSNTNDISIHVTCKESRLYHSDAVAERFYNILKGGSLPLVRTPSLSTPSPRGHAPNTPTQHLYVEFLKDRCTVSLDLAGEELYKRGHQRFVAEAPLKETIAAAMLLEAETVARSSAETVAAPNTGITIIDPMAGSGTFSLEAAYKNCGLIPGRCRDFALKHQPAFKEATWNYILNERFQTQGSKERHPERSQTAKDPGPNPTIRIVTSDISERAVEIIKHNVQTSPLPPGTMDPQQKDFFSYTPGGKTILLLNPPYGKRLDADAPALYSRIGKKLKELSQGAESPLTVAILAPKGPCSENLLKSCPALAAPKAKTIKTSHGGISLNCFIAAL